MNLHPIVIHFPIACLILYTMVEVLGFFSTKIKEGFLNTKYVLLFIGVIGTFAALQTGEIAEHMMSKSTLIETHSTFANLTHFTYMIIAVLYAIGLIVQYKIGEKYRTSLTKKYISKIILFLNHRYTYYIIIALSIIGAILLSITGALGGAISHGPNTDPIVQFVYNLFISQ